MTAMVILESWSRVAPLGVRFVDDQNGRVIGDGLQVTAWPSAEPSRLRAVPQGRTNVFYLMNVGGLRDLEFGAGDDAYWAGLPRHLAFTLEVNDRYGRFLPFRFNTTLPVRGLLRLACGSPSTPAPLPAGAEADGVPLFTAPARSNTPGTVVIRADLWDAANHVPAAWAMLEARTPGARLRGEPPVRALADHLGRVALHFPIPDAGDFDGGSFDSPSGGASGAALGQRTFTVELDALYAHLPPAADTLTRPLRPIPELCAALNQPPARLWDRLGGAPVALSQTTLRFGQDTSLRSSNVGSEPASVLLLTPSQSPP
ncbi:MAG TPA: hypothetical protein VGL59_18925 [Polyangia bacterium]|jgi:hypothetical protein